MAFTTIDDPSAHFQVTEYAGAGGSSNISRTFDGNSDLQPDLTWHKSRGQTYNHYMFDSTRGVGLYLSPNVNVGDDGSSGDTTSLASFDSDGFTLAASQGISDGSAAIMCWGWKANGGTTSSNTSGSITSTVQADTTAGFSIITYTGNNTDGATFGHGLGAVPHFIIIKKRSNTGNWMTYHQNLGADKAVFLDLNNATESSSFYQETPTSTLVTLNDHGNVNANSETYVCYCFTSIQGYSKFGSYTGNGNADGTFVYTGFAPAWIMQKRTNSSTDAHWHIFDIKRDTKNPRITRLEGNNNFGDSSGEGADFLSNGFKWRSNDVRYNGSDDTYIYMAFAENPFVSSEGVPCTAR